MTSIVKELLKAKKHSDNMSYHEKTQIVRRLLEKHPGQFKIDSRQTHTVGLTHKPSGFRIHLTKGGLPLKFIKHQSLYGGMQKAAFMQLIAV